MASSLVLLCFSSIIRVNYKTDIVVYVNSRCFDNCKVVICFLHFVVFLQGKQCFYVVQRFGDNSIMDFNCELIYLGVQCGLFIFIV